MKPKLLIITDLGLLKAYRLDLTPKGTPHLELLDEVVLEDAHQKLNQKLTDLSGRNAGTAQRAGTAVMADSHNLELEFERRLVRQIAGKVEKLISRHGQDGCWLAAPKEINHLLTGELPREARDRIQVNHARNLTKIEPRKLLDHFPGALPAGVAA